MSARPRSVASRRAVLKRLKGRPGGACVFLVHGPRGASQVVRGDARRDGGRADGRDGLRRIVDPLPGFNARIEELDMVVIPDPATFQLMPRPVDEHGHELGAKVGAARSATSSSRTASPTKATRATRRAALDGCRARPRICSPCSALSSNTFSSRTTRAPGCSTRAATPQRPPRTPYRGAQRHGDQRARVGRHPDRVPPPRARRRSTRST